MEPVIKSGKLAEFKQLIKDKADFNVYVIDSKRNKPIHLASLYGRMDIIEFLLANHVNVNEGDIENFTALHYAAGGGHTEIIITLIVNNADPKAVTITEGLNFIHIAAKCGHVNVLKELFPSKEKSDETKYCWTLQHNATSRQDSETIEDTIDNDGDMQKECKCRLRDTFSHMAAGIRNKCASIFLNKGISLEAASNSGMTPFLFAAKFGQFQVVEYLAKIKVNIHAKCKAGYTALHYSSKYKQLDVIKLLIQLGCDVNARNGINFTSLHLATHYGRQEVMELLLNNGANLNDRVQGLKPIHIATCKGHKNVVEFILRKGGNVNESSFSQQTPLHKAVIRGNLEMVKLLISKGADIDAVDSNGQKSFHMALLTGSVKMVEYFIEMGFDPNECSPQRLTPLIYAIISKKIEMVKFMLQKKVLVCEKGPNGVTPLMLAIRLGLTEIALLLLENGASKVSNNEKLLHYAVKHGNVALVKALIKCGFDPDELDFEKNTPLHIAAAQNELEILKYLIEKGADPNFKNVYGSSTIMIAADKGNLEIINCLIES